MSKNIEDLLSVDWDISKTPYPAKWVILPTGDKMVIREASRDEVPLLLKAITPLLTVPSKYYDIVSARLYAELLGWYRRRVRNEYCLIGVVNKKLVGIVNNRLVNRKTAISLHTITLDKGKRIGAHLFAAKQEYAMEYLGVEEILVTAESPLGFDRWMIEWGLEFREGIQHELGGANTWALTREGYNQHKSKLVFGRRPVPEELYKMTLQPEIIVEI